MRSTLLPGLASSGLTSNRHSLLVRVDEVQGYQGGQVVAAYTKRISPVQPYALCNCCECATVAQGDQLRFGSIPERVAVADYKPCNNLTVADNRSGVTGTSTDLQSPPSFHKQKKRPGRSPDCNVLHQGTPVIGSELTTPCEVRRAEPQIPVRRDTAALLGTPAPYQAICRSY